MMGSMKKVGVSELSGSALDWAVAMAEGAKPERPQDGQVSFGRVNMLCGVRKHRLRGEYDYSPSTDWSQGGPLIDKYDIDAFSDQIDDQARFVAILIREDDLLCFSQSGPTRLIAACRAIVAAKIGDVVEVPEELLEAQA